MNETHQFLVMAAFYEGARPGSRFRSCRNVILLALRMAGQRSYQEMNRTACDEFDPEIDAYYQVLLDQMKPTEGADLLFEGRGNLGDEREPPAYPAFTSCRLTDAGVALAEQLFERHPQLREYCQAGNY